MCGLLGIFPDGKKIDLSAFNKLMDNSRTRGRDATGVLIYNNKDDYAIMKSPGPCLLVPTYPDITKSRCIVGHVRKATVGHPERNVNNHPFNIGKFIGFHNGTCESAIKVATDLGLDTFESDSLALMSIIDFYSKQNDTPTSIKIALSSLEMKDTFSIILFDTEDNSVYFARETGRPLILCPTMDGLAIASESIFFSYLYLTGEKYGIRFIHTQETKSNIIYKVSLDDLKIKNVEKFEQKSYAGYNAGHELYG
jgi:glucosamine 6-phosphate synthetase-like amidotransferase/phosphosugar isomerase protein